MPTETPWMQGNYQNFLFNLDALLSRAIGTNYQSAWGFEFWPYRNRPEGSGKLLSWHEAALTLLEASCQQLRQGWENEQAYRILIPGTFKFVWSWAAPEEEETEEIIRVRQRYCTGYLHVRYTPDRDENAMTLFHWPVRYHAFHALQREDGTVQERTSLYDALFQLAYEALDSVHYARYKSHLHSGRFGVEAFDGVYEALRWEYLYQTSGAATAHEEVEITEDHWVVLPAGIPKWLQICHQLGVKKFRLYVPLQKGQHGMIGRFEFHPLRTALIGPPSAPNASFHGVEPLPLTAIETTHRGELYLACEVTPLAFCQVVYAALWLDHLFGQPRGEENRWVLMQNWETDRQEALSADEKISPWYAVGNLYAGDKLRDALYLRLILSNVRPPQEEPLEEEKIKRGKGSSRAKPATEPPSTPPEPKETEPSP